MKFLLDTHAFIWWDSEPERLSARTLAMLEDPSNIPVVSVATFWEIQIKIVAGRMDLNLPLETIVRTCVETDISILPITVPHVLALDSLPDHHRDPFDRILVAQAVAEHLPIVSKDSKIARYPVATIW